MDPFDLICHTAFDQPPLTRAERVNNVKKRDYFTQYGEQARKVLEALLDKYADEGIENIEDMKILQVNPLDQFGSPLEIVKLFRGKKAVSKSAHRTRTRNLQKGSIMNNQKKALARKLFKLKIHEANGQAFEDIFTAIMNYVESDFQSIKPWGNIGDRKND